MKPRFWLTLKKYLYELHKTEQWKLAVTHFYSCRIEEEESDKYNIPAKVESEKYRVIRTFSFFKSRMSSTRNKSKVGILTQQQYKECSFRCDWCIFLFLLDGNIYYVTSPVCRVLTQAWNMWSFLLSVRHKQEMFLEISQGRGDRPNMVSSLFPFND